MHQRFAEFVTNQLNKTLHSFLSPRCCLCGQRTPINSPAICLLCYQRLPRWQHGCQVCGMPLKQAGNEQLCGQCQIQRPMFDRLVALGWYQHDIRSLVSRFKYQHDLVAGRALTDSWLMHNSPGPLPQVLLPVPIHKNKLASRGFNQAYMIAKDLSQRLGVKLDTNQIKRLKEGHSQTGQNRENRMKEVRKLYSVSQSIPYKHVAIVDDVVTTQATVNVISELLRDAGADKIDIWSIARTP